MSRNPNGINPSNPQSNLLIVPCPTCSNALNFPQPTTHVMNTPAMSSITSIHPVVISCDGCKSQYALTIVGASIQYIPEQLETKETPKILNPGGFRIPKLSS